MPLFSAARHVVSPGRRYGASRRETRDPMGYALAALNTVAQSNLVDRLGLRKATEHAVFRATRSGFLTRANRRFSRQGKSGGTGVRLPAARDSGVFDLTPTEDQRMFVDVAADFAAGVVRPAAAEANEACAAPDSLLEASLEIGLPILGVPESHGGISEARSAMTGTLVAEALAKGDMGLAVAVLAPGAVAISLSLWGTDAQQQTYLREFAGDDVPVTALALTEPRVLFDPFRPKTTATRTDDGFVLDGVKSLVPRGAEAELFVIGADLGGSPTLFLVESGTTGLQVEDDPCMGVRASGMTRVVLDSVRIGPDAVLGETDGSTYTECVRLSRLAWCAMAVGTAQAVLDYVTPYVNERHAFGEPISHRQSVAFMVADIAIELQAMRLVTYKAASRAARGKDFSREVALARAICADKGMRIGLDGVQLLGGHGYVKEHPVERWYRDLRAIGLAEGGVLV